MLCSKMCYSHAPKIFPQRRFGAVGGKRPTKIFPPLLSMCLLALELLVQHHKQEVRFVALEVEGMIRQVDGLFIVGEISTHDILGLPIF